MPRMYFFSFWIISVINSYSPENNTSVHALDESQSVEMNAAHQFDQTTTHFIGNQHIFGVATDESGIYGYLRPNEENFILPTLSSTTTVCKLRRKLHTEIKRWFIKLMKHLEYSIENYDSVQMKECARAFYDSMIRFLSRTIDAIDLPENMTTHDWFINVFTDFQLKIVAELAQSLRMTIDTLNVTQGRAIKEELRHLEALSLIAVHLIDNYYSFGMYTYENCCFLYYTILYFEANFSFMMAFFISIDSNVDICMYTTLNHAVNQILIFINSILTRLNCISNYSALNSMCLCGFSHSHLCAYIMRGRKYCSLCLSRTLTNACSLDR